MNLKEFEGKHILKKYNLLLPKSTLIKKDDPFPKFEHNVILKAQTISGKRKAAGGIVICKSQEELEQNIKEIFSKQINTEQVQEILIEELINIQKELYISITLDTKVRRPILVLSSEGGSDIEEIKQKTPEKIKSIEIDVLEGVNKEELKNISQYLELNSSQYIEFEQIINTLFKAYKENDLKLLEINPLAITENGFIITDTKIIIDDNGLPRLELPFERTTGYRKKTDREKRANAIDENDHKGVSGKTFVDFDGDIGIMTSGGGATIIGMDAIISYGGKPANYTEYSGNPPAYKVEKLTRIVLDRDNLSGLWVAGGIANFTDIYATLKAILDVLIEKKVDFPIIIRRGGPNEKEAFDLLRKAAKEHNLNIQLYGRETPITLSAKYMVDASEKYKEQKLLGGIEE